MSISTETGEQANRIFEILNAKGKHLNEVDLIKNKIFEYIIPRKCKKVNVSEINRTNL